MYIVVNVCETRRGTFSNIVGVFQTQREADVIASLCHENFDVIEGQTDEYTVFKLPDVGVVKAEYAEGLCIEKDLDGLHRFKLST